MKQEHFMYYTTTPMDTIHDFFIASDNNSYVVNVW